jgi:hypothetical protein
MVVQPDTAALLLKPILSNVLQALDESINHPSGVRVSTHHTTLSVVFQDPSFTSIHHPSESDLPSMTTLPLPTRGIPYLYISEFDWLDSPDFK